MTSIEKLKSMLDSSGFKYRLFSHGKVVTMADVQRELGVGLSLTVKAMIIKAEDDFYIVALPGDRRLDRKKMASFLGRPVKSVDLASAAEAQGVTGLPLGGDTPIRPRP